MQLKQIFKNILFKDRFNLFHFIAHNPLSDEKQTFRNIYFLNMYFS